MNVPRTKRTKNAYLILIVAIVIFFSLFLHFQTATSALYVSDWIQNNPPSIGRPAGGPLAIDEISGESMALSKLTKHPFSVYAERYHQASDKVYVQTPDEIPSFAKSFIRVISSRQYESPTIPMQWERDVFGDRWESEILDHPWTEGEWTAVASAGTLFEVKNAFIDHKGGVVSLVPSQEAPNISPSTNLQNYTRVVMKMGNFWADATDFPLYNADAEGTGAYGIGSDSHNRYLSLIRPWGNAFSHVVATELPVLNIACNFLRSPENADVFVLVQADYVSELAQGWCELPNERFVTVEYDKPLFVARLFFPVFWNPLKALHDGLDMHHTHHIGMYPGKLRLPSSSGPGRIRQSVKEDRPIVYIPRKHKGTRWMANEVEILHALCDCCTGVSEERKEEGAIGTKASLQIFEPKDDWKHDQGAIADARVVLSVHSGAMANMLFAPEDAALVEINQWDSNPFYRGFTHVLGLNHTLVIPTDFSFYNTSIPVKANVLDVVRAIKHSAPALSEPDAKDAIKCNRMVEDWARQRMASSSTVVIAAALNYGINVFSPFVMSLRKVYHGDVVLFVSPDLPDEVKNLCESYNIRTEHMPTDQTSVKGARYVGYTRVCSSYEWCFATDFRDAFFQADPFASIPDGYDLILAQEDPSTPIKDCPFNSGWIKTCWSEDFLNEIGDNLPLCSGTIMGTSAGFDALTKAMLSEMDKTSTVEGCHEMDGFDQGHFNYLYYSDSLKNVKTMVQPKGQGIVSTVGRGEPSILGGLVRNDDGAASAVVHQYDRSEDLVSIASRLSLGPLATTSDGKLSLCIGIIAYQGVETLEATLASYKAAGLFETASKVHALFQLLDKPERLAWAKDVVSRFPKLTPFYQETNTGHRAFQKLVESCTGSRYTLVLEEDFQVSKKVTSGVQPQFDNAAWLLENGVDAVRMRHRLDPGEPNWTYNMACAGNLMSTHIIDYVMCEEAAEKNHTEIWVCKDVPKTWCTSSKHGHYTNNPVMYRTDFLAELFSLVPDSEMTYEKFEPWLTRHWAEEDYTVAYPDAIFVHNRLDRTFGVKYEN